MNELLYTALLNALAVFIGLYVLWTFVGIMVPRQRAYHAAIAGTFAALATLIVYWLVIVFDNASAV